MVQFTNLRLSGFKSFVDPADLVIEPGLTGVVGPNGCGKSNLVEALKWVMGENSAKRMRGGEMDDVIFAGTANRPSRNIADVVMTLDNRDRSAPAQYNESEQIEVSRRITRGHGSSYKINGKDVRAKDVQLLFADIATGAHSTAMVSQGRVGALINAKPAQRRALLEEAAGITGLYSRRHEAELRLRAAETNLERLDDVIATLESQLQNLKKQSRQATRYKNVNAHIRRYEAILLHLETLAAKQTILEAEGQLAESERRVADSSRKTAEASRVQAEVAAGLPELRQREAEAAAILQRLLIDRDSLQREAERVEAQRTQVEERLAQIKADRQRIEHTLADANEAESRLEAERDGLTRQEEGEKDEKSAAKDALATAREQLEQQERLVTELSQKLAADDARANSLTQQIRSSEARIERLENELRRAEAEKKSLEASRPHQFGKEESEQAIANCEKVLDLARQEADGVSEAMARAREDEEAARDS
ncbi:MAG: AAA family ATPase, partial [Kiloniellales bacterium]|nr:AAA family ATPase [Kiloniellales bacterium]